MSRSEEIEVKIAAPDVATIRRVLRQAGFRIFKPRIFEQNIVLDDSQASLRSRNLLLRVRSTGKIVTCTFKGGPRPGIHKRREEREFRADNLEECLALFKGLGYEPSFRYEKHRTEFKRDGDSGVATLDETVVGIFMELEGPARWIDRTAKELGYSRNDYILASYIRLFAEWDAAHRRQRV